MTIQKKNNTEQKKQTLHGVVVSDACDKTIVVSVAAYKKHKKYHKRYTTTKKYKVHDEQNTHKIGDDVAFVQCKPHSKDKTYTVVGS